MRLDVLSKFLGNLPGAGGNPWVGLVYIATLITGAGLVRFMFFSVQKSERGLWLRLGGTTYPLVFELSFPFVRFDTCNPKVLRPGHPGIRFPFVWKLIKISIALRTNSTEDLEVPRYDPLYDTLQKWVMHAKVNWRVQTRPEQVRRAALRAGDLEESVLAIIQGALKEYMRETPVPRWSDMQLGMKKDSDEMIKKFVKDRYKARLAGLGVAITSVNTLKFAPVDAAILARGLEKSGSAGIVAVV